MGNGKKNPMKDSKELGAALGMNPDQKPHKESRSQVPVNTNNIGPEPAFLKPGADYVSVAEDRIKNLMTDNRSNPFGNLTTSKIRNILTIVNEIKSEVDRKDEILSDRVVDRIRHIKVRLAYEAGREKDSSDRVKKIKEFIETAELITAIDHIGHSSEKFLRYCDYLEALVAYHRFYGGKDK